MKISHSYRNGGDNRAVPTIIYQPAQFFITADADTDADGSLRVGSIDPKSGQSCTSLGKANGWRGAGQYCDSEKIPFFVLPMNFSKVTGIKVKLGDIALLSYGEASVYAIFADEGPNDLIGEASICAIEALGGNPWSADGKKIVRGIPHGVTYQVFCGSEALAVCTDFDSIQAYGASQFGKVSNPKKKPDIEKPTPPETPKEKRIRIGLLDPGHSEKHTGARSVDKSVEEEDLTLFQAGLLQKELIAHGFGADIVNPIGDNLEEIGYLAEKYDFLISIHFNSYQGYSDPGHEVLVDNDKGSAESIHLGQLICEELSQALGSTNRGVKRQGLMVLDRAEQVCKGPCVLVESFFLNPYGPEQAKLRATKAASAICRAVVAYFS